MSSVETPASPEDSRQALSDLEFSMIVSYNGFVRWVSYCAKAAGARGFSPLDVLVLHMVNHRARNKALSDICLVMNIEDSHTVAYSLKKLEEHGYVEHRQMGRDRVYVSSAEGDAFVARYLEVRKKALVETMAADNAEFDRISGLADTLGSMARYYSHASRSAVVGVARRSAES